MAFQLEDRADQDGCTVYPAWRFTEKNLYNNEYPPIIYLCGKLSHHLLRHLGRLHNVSSQNMSAWRRKALELFPDLRSDIEDPDASVMGLFFELLPRCRDAHGRNDSEELKRIYGFADWCASQKAKELWNAAGVGFYEHLADSTQTFDAMPLWVRKQVFEDIAGLLEERVGIERVAELRRRDR